MFFFQQMQQQNTQKVEASKVPEYIKKAAKKAAEFNSNLNRERMEERRAYFDLQTHVGWPSSVAPGAPWLLLQNGLHFFMIIIIYYYGASCVSFLTEVKIPFLMMYWVMLFACPLSLPSSWNLFALWLRIYWARPTVAMYPNSCVPRVVKAAYCACLCFWWEPCDVRPVSPQFTEWEVEL